ncbi:putative Nucleosome assembly protein (NAP) [Blattamonas nauphoetae]|uniref:Nucleosome assembly protein (NAP) n=1 Tax=Blattamonas nauphoetae TaxID=2049346 RepID=A0ABQ9WSC6_9EUKA|nr:putative Nucleosome assembly protein (NAP) [Blattamonas nauphoetae]
MDEQRFNKAREIQDKIDAETDKLREQFLPQERKMMKEVYQIFLERDETLKKVPNFWFFVINNTLDFLPTFHDEDASNVLNYCTSITVVPSSGDGSTYLLKAEFKENPYFENQTLQKEFPIDPSPDAKVGKGTDIKWKSGKNLSEAHIAAAKKSKDSDLAPFTFLDLFSNANPKEFDEFRLDLFHIFVDTIYPDPMAVFMGDDDVDEDSDESVSDEEGDSEESFDSQAGSDDED